MVPTLLDTPTLAIRLGVSRSRIKRMVEAGQIPHVALPDGTVAFDLGEIERWVDSLRRPVSAPERQPARERRP